MRVHVGSDHAAVVLRQAMVAALGELGHEVVSELGPAHETDSVDYPDVAAEVCAKVLAEPGSFGLLVCGTGQGMAMAANGIVGIRAAVLSDAFSARAAREHNDANVLCLGARVIGLGLARVLVETFFATAFAGGRHARRVAKLDELRRR